jgi:hypothetical protein
MRIAGFAKFRNEILREGDLYRVLACLAATCNGGVLCDDASTDGTREHLRAWVAARTAWSLLEVSPAEQAFEKEIAVKQVMLDFLHARARTETFDWILWLDGDEELVHRGGLPLSSGLRTWLNDFDAHGAPGVRMHYTQLWKNESWARTDQGFDDGSFVKLWRYHPDLSFDTTPGTHRSQFPQQIEYAACETAIPIEVIHYGNVGKNLVWKAVQYAEGRGGVDRHIAFGHSPAESMATGEGFDASSWSAPHPTYRHVGQGTDLLPEPFSLEEIRRIRSFGSMRALPRWFTIVIPAYQRAATLPRALDSVLNQRYERWLCVVLDDGSTDDTPAVMRRYQDKDPRIFYARYETNRGGVAMNEIGMALACEWTEWWTRLGSDDWWGPGKLARDAAALGSAEAVYGPYTVWRDGRFAEICNPPMMPSFIEGALLDGRFLVSWANVAVRTSVLRRVKEKYGAWADPRLRNCEDLLANARIASMADWVWRDNGGELDAVWTAAPTGGASSADHSHVLATDEALSREIIAGMRSGNG